MQDFDIQLQQQQPQPHDQQQHHFRSESADIITFPYPLCKTEEEKLKAMALKPNQVRSTFVISLLTSINVQEFILRGLQFVKVCSILENLTRKNWISFLEFA